MEVQLTEFRRDIKRYLDVAISGERIIITRGGIRFALIPEVQKISKPKPAHKVESNETTYIPMVD